MENIVLEPVCLENKLLFSENFIGLSSVELRI